MAIPRTAMPTTTVAKAAFACAQTGSHGWFDIETRIVPSNFLEDVGLAITLTQTVAISHWHPDLADMKYVELLGVDVCSDGAAGYWPPALLRI